MPRYYWDGKDDSGNVVGSGLYFVHIEAGDYKETKKIVVVK
jgi:flagellar hook assembly protein FlgD